MAEMIPNIGEINNIIDYSPDTGLFFWKARNSSGFVDGRWSAERRAAHWNKKYAGSEALTSDNGSGYKQGFISGQKVYAHRVAFLLMTGTIPLVVDHINRDKSDNRWINLRDVSQSLNMKNTGIRADNSSGVVGVSMAKGGRWQAYINIDMKRVHLGTFKDKADAIRVRRKAELENGYLNPRPPV